MTDEVDTGTKETGQEKLRREAYALGWNKLTQTQRDAFTRIVGALEAAQRDIYLHEEQVIRSSQLIFLSGQRGTGKTTLMLSLRDAFQNSKFNWRGAGAEAVQVGNLDKKIVWLEPIDMDPLPTTSHLLAAVLARVEASAKPPEDREGGLLDRRPDDERALLKLRALQSDVVMAWEGNLSERATALDPEVYAIEALKSERAKIDLSGRLNKSLKEVSLLRAQQRHSKEDQLFVLPVDDFDMNPSRAIELLKLIRFVAVPRLFTLILGDIGLAEEMLYYKMSGEIARLKAPRSDLRTISNEAALAAQSMRKLIPPTQRIELGLMDVKIAREYSEAKFGGKEDTKEKNKRLDELLSGINYSLLGLPRKSSSSVASPPEVFGITISNLEGFLFFKDLTEVIKQGDAKKVDKYGYDGREILHAPSRQVADLWLALHQLDAKLVDKNLKRDNLSDDEKIERDRYTLDVFANELRKAIAEDLNLGFEARQALSRSIAKSPLDEEWELNTDAIRVETHLSRAMCLKPKNEDQNESKQTRELYREVSSHRILRWDIHVDPERLTKGRTPHGGELLSGRTRAALILFHDLLQLSDAGVVSGEFRDDHLKDRAYTEWHDGISPKPMKIEWFESIWTTFWEANIFMRLWNKGQLTVRDIREKNSASADDDLLRHLAYIWIAASITVLSVDQQTKPFLEETLYTKPRDNKGQIPKCKLKWENLAEAVNALVKEYDALRGRHEDDRRTADMEKWFINFACLMAPETGIDWEDNGKDCREFFLKADKSKGIQELFQKTYMARSIKRHRLERLGPYAHSSVGVAFICTDQKLGEKTDGIEGRINGFREEIKSDIFNNFPDKVHSIFCPTLDELREWDPPEDYTSASRHDVWLVRKHILGLEDRQKLDAVDALREVFGATGQQK